MPSTWQRELLINYGPTLLPLMAAFYRQVDKVLRGDNPAEMPIEEPTVFDIIINRKLAKAMGLAIPTSVLLQATEVID